MSESTHALIGATGFVGGVLAATHSFVYQFDRANSAEMRGREVDLAVCAAAPGTKWLANSQPDEDRVAIVELMRNLKELRAKKFVLISTVDVFAKPVAVYEDTPIVIEGLHPYGTHRRELEEFVMANFDAHIIRLPALFGQGLKKNALFDLLHGKTEFVDPRAVLQWYSLARLWSDIERVVAKNIPLMHMATEPFALREIVEEIFGLKIERELTGTPAMYDLRTRYAAQWGAVGDYILSKQEVMQDLKQFVSTWPKLYD